MSMLRTILLTLPILGVFGIAVYYLVFAWGLGVRCRWEQRAGSRWFSAWCSRLG